MAVNDSRQSVELAVGVRQLTQRRRGGLIAAIYQCYNSFRRLFLYGQVVVARVVRTWMS